MRYGALKALSDVSFDVAAGTVLGVIGPNGAGKSSTFAALTNIAPHSGEVKFKGNDLGSSATSDLARIGLKRTFQHNSFFGELSTIENAVCALHSEHSVRLAKSFFRPFAARRDRDQARLRAEALLDRFSIPRHYFEQRPSEIPYGTQRLLSIALAFGEGADLILLDEPAAGIGGNDMDALMQVLVGLRAGGTGVILIEHHMELIMAIADQVIVLEQGKLIATGSADAIRRDERVIEAYLGREQ